MCMVACRCEAEAGTRSDLWHRAKQLEEKLAEATQKLGVTTRALKAAERQLGECAAGRGYVTTPGCLSTLPMSLHLYAAKHAWLALLQQAEAR